MTPTPERKYAMTRVAAGDYLFPSNDGKRLWRVTRYHEYGDAERQDAAGEWQPIVGDFWQALRFDGTIDEAEQLLERAVDETEFLWSDRWHTWSMGLRTRRDAIDEALRAPETWR